MTSLRAFSTTGDEPAPPPMSAQPRTVDHMANRLAAATSPYLQQHADNPVHWWEWGQDAFTEAKNRNVPILLSVGYAACHWCHVMAHESFEDEATAQQMNEGYVNIKVDREERPDVDAIYMQATTAMTGHGGWPMTCVLDHEGNPFFAGTYFPDEPRHGQPSFRQVLAAISDAWVNRGDDIRRTADALREHLNQQRQLPPGTLTKADLDNAVNTLSKDFDARRGGFGGAPKFPPSMVLEFLGRMGGGFETPLRGSSTTGQVARTSNTGQVARTSTTGESATSMLDKTLDAMARGGIHDQLAGGFARYSVDNAWVVPHFEKMLYDNALLLGVYAQHGDTAVAEDIAGWLHDEMRTDEGGFASALDADSEGVEGKFYAWTPQQLIEALGPDDGIWAAEFLTVTARGTFEHGSSTLQQMRDPIDDAETQRWISVRHRLLHKRAERVRPARDDKVVAAWNGLAISGLLALSQRSNEQAYAEWALQAAQLIKDLHIQGRHLKRVSRDGEVGAPAGVLEDYGCVATAFLDLVQHTSDPVWLTAATDLLDTVLAHFRADDGGFFDTADDAEVLVARPKDPSDNASPSGTSSIIHALIKAAAITGDDRYRTAAEQALASLHVLVTQAPRFAGWSLAAAVALQHGPPEVAIVGPEGPARDKLARIAREHPTAVVVVVDDATAEIPLLAGREALGGHPTAYVCRRHVCQRPVTTAEELAALLAETTR